VYLLKTDIYPLLFADTLSLQFAQAWQNLNTINGHILEKADNMMMMMMKMICLFFE